MGYIAGIGGANMDIHGRSDRQLIMRDSNPGSLHTSLGGVCRNICENLARLGETVRLITVVGDDVQGRGIIEGCEKAGIDKFVESGMRIGGVNPDRDLVEIVELPNHPWFVGVQYHPELKSRPNRPHPLFREFVGAALAYQDK